MFVWNDFIVNNLFLFILNLENISHGRRCTEIVELEDAEVSGGTPREVDCNFRGQWIRKGNWTNTRALRVIPRGKRRLTVYRTRQVIRVHEGIRSRLALENWWPGGVVFLFLSKFASSFAENSPWPSRAIKMLQNDVCLASGYAFAPEKSVPKQNHAPARITKILMTSTVPKAIQNVSEKLLC